MVTPGAPQAGAAPPADLLLQAAAAAVPVWQHALGPQLAVCACLLGTAAVPAGLHSSYLHTPAQVAHTTSGKAVIFQ